MADSRVSNGGKGGLFEKLLLPGYADAGASTSFRPVSSDQSSEAATEIHDNRTRSKLEESRKNITDDDRDSKIHHPFFPSTDASLKLQQQQQLQENDHEEKKQQQVDDAQQQQSPRPQSPPTLSRRQMPARSIAGSSTIPETGERFNPNLVGYRPTDSKETGASSLHGAISGGTGGARFQFYSPAAEDGQAYDDFKNSTKAGGIELDATSDAVQQQRGHDSPIEQMQRGNDPQGGDTLSRLPFQGSAAMRDTSLFERDSDILSDVNSTASEMGTVINIGASAARMAEVEEMAALIEASPHFDSYGSRDTTTHEDDNIRSGPALPILEEADNDGISLSYDSNVLGPSSPPKSNLLPFRQSSVPLRDLGMESGASAVVSAAIRRLGSGLNSNKFKPSNDDQKPLTAPPTPAALQDPPTPRVDDLLKSSLEPKESSSDIAHVGLPSTFALRSPGSAARHSLSLLATVKDATPTVSRNNFKQVHDIKKDMESEDGRRDAETSEDDTRNTESRIHVPTLGDMLPRPFQFARKCMSFDSTLDEDPLAYQIDRMDTMLHNRTPERTAKYRVLGPSMSWDVEGVTSSYGKDFRRRSRQFTKQYQQGAFRAEPNRHSGPAFRSNADPEEALQQRARLHSDFSPGKTSEAVELQTPQRIEIEREDALDILACLVERGVALDQNDTENISNSKSNGDLQGEPTEASAQAEAKSRGPKEIAPEITEFLEELRIISKECGNSSELLPTGAQNSHNARMAALDELMRSHSYALEMKRAALSASAWLKSIGRSSANRSDEIDVTQGKFENGLVRTGDELSSKKASPGSQKMEILSLKALLHTAQIEAKEKAEAAMKLDEELSKCRAEIGRLRSAARTETTLPPHDRSILDDDTESGRSGLVEVMNISKDSPSPIAKESSELYDDVVEGSPESLFRSLDNEAEQLDSLVLKAALDEANNIIKDLHEQLANLSNEESQAPIVDIPGISNGDDNRMVNVRMLDGENFVTEWDDLTPPLPPPPDHGLHSPIVHAVLEQWATDRSLHESLLSWIERVMSGHDVESVPPLTISSLDHQVRDGFTMHVLPLLLRRADIHVAVQTRAHRRTTYDMAVTVNPKDGQLPLVDANGFVGSIERVATQDGTSDANQDGMDEHSHVTEVITNVSRQSPPTYKNFPPYGGDAVGNVTEGNFPGTITSSEHTELSDALAQQQGIMGALGGALGGLLSRRKYSASTSPSRHSELGMDLPAPMRARMDLTSSPVPTYYPQDDDQPYHRVVSAPPGRIGMTFVEFRGHAMVSDVAADSPLSGWVFPSDILIAIDEIPVSGMRVRDIVKVLTTRKNRQRAMRVISSHAMNEFTRASSEVG